MTTRITCISDTHGYLPEIPDCDILLHAGDILPLNIQRDPIASMKWIRGEFTEWVNEIESRNIKILSIWGNHDFIGENGHRDYLSDMFLTDRQVIFNGFKIYGTPYQSYFGGWAFNLYDNELHHKYDLIPEDTDILLVHNPPYGILDGVEEVYAGKEIRRFCGSQVLRDRLEYLPNLKLCVFGHIHPGNGIQINKTPPHTTFVNASLLNDHYQLVNQPIVINLPEQ